MDASDVETTIAFVILKKEEMQDTIARAVHVAVQKFEADTGLTPNAINVPMLEVTKAGSQRRRYLPGTVTCPLDSLVE